MKPSPRLLLREGDQFVFEEDGGSGAIGGTRVDAVVAWERPLTPGNRYLLFGRIQDGTYVKEGAYEEANAGDTLERMTARMATRPGTDAKLRN